MFNKSKYVYVMVVFFRRFLTQNWYAWYFLYHLFTFCDSFSAIIGSPLLFSTCYNSKCLHFFFFGKYSFNTHYNVYKEKKNNYSNFSQISIEKNVNMGFVNITFCQLRFFVVVYFFSEAFLQAASKNNPTKKYTYFKIQVTLKHAPAFLKNLRRWKYCNKLKQLQQITDKNTNYNCLHTNVVSRNFCCLD